MLIEIDTTAPVAPSAPALTAASDSGASGDGVTASSPVLEGTALANAKVALYDGATLVGTTVADGAGKWTIAPAGLQAGTHILAARQYDAAGNLSGASDTFTLQLQQRPAPVNLVDGVVVGVTPVSLPGGQSGTAVSIPIIKASRVDSSGSPGVADIPLASNSSGASLLTAQLGPGFGLSAVGANMLAADVHAALGDAINAAAPGHAPGDLEHLIGTAQGFLNRLPGTQSLLLETITPVAADAAGPAAITLSGSGSDGQHVALVLDGTQLPQGSTLQLKNIDFGAVIGRADVVADSSTQVLAGDAASQHFTLAAGGSGSVFAGGGDDVITWGVPSVQNGTNAGAQMALLHGGAGIDTAAFNGTRDSFTVELHNGYAVVSSKTQPDAKALVVNVEQLVFADGTVTLEAGADLTAIAGLYQSIFARQADLYGFEFWAGAHQKSGLSLGTLAVDMIGQGEWASSHEALNGNAQHDVGILYNALFGRAADAAGLNFWIDAIQHLGLTLEQVADYMVRAPEMVAHQLAATAWDFHV